MQLRLSIQAVLALLLSVAVCKHAAADDPTQVPQAQADSVPVGLPIATVNIKHVFDQHSGFQKEIAKLKSEADKLAEDHARLVSELEARKKQLGSEDLPKETRKKLNERLLRTQAELATLAPIRQRDLREREARLYGSVYKEIQDGVAKLARKHHTQVVFRDHELNAETLAAFAILFHERTDRTKELVQLLNGSDSQHAKQVDSDNAKTDKKQFRIAVADLHKILSAYPKHESRLASLREKTRDLETNVADEQTKLKALEAQATLLDRSSKDFEELVKKGSRQKAEAEMRLKAKKKEIDTETARAAEQTLKEITHLIGEFSRTRGISLVLNVSTAPIEPKDPASVLKGVAQQIVYHADHDISDDIITLFSGDAQDSNETQDDDNSKESERFGGKIALMDMAVVYKSNEQFATRMASLKQEIAEFSAYLQNRQSVLEELRSLLNALEQGTETHQATSKQLARESAELKVEVELKKSELKRKEAMCYAATYEEIQESLTRMVRARGIGLVVRFDSQPINSDDQKSILSGLNRTVVFQNEVDITGDFIRVTKAPPSVELR